eukprot:PITA_36567
MKQAAPDVIFIQGTKCSIQKIKEIHSKWLNRFEFLEVKAENTVGGILMLWNPQKIDIIDVEASRDYLSVVIQPVGDKEIYLVTNVYGPKRMDGKLRLLYSLQELREQHAKIPWILGGDFNMIKSLSEKKGGTRILSKESCAFQTFIDNMKLMHIVMNNDTFTWNNKRGKYQGIDKPRNRRFRFENIWLSHPNFNNNITIWWAEDLEIQGTRMFLLQKRLKHIKLRLKEWNKKEYGNIFEAKKIVEGKMQKLNQTLIMEGFDKEKNDLAAKYHQNWENLCKQAEIFWRQKSRVQWLKEGEHNTRFFHRSTMENRAHNRISSIKDEGGKMLSVHEDIKAVLV